MFYAEFNFKQSYHRVTQDSVAPQMYFSVKLPFDEGLTWVVGRRPNNFGNFPNYYAIPIYNPAITSVLFQIRSIMTNHGGLHLIKPLSDKQYLNLRGKLINQEHILKDGDTLKVSSLPLEISYKIIKFDIKTEDDTLSFMPDE